MVHFSYCFSLTLLHSLWQSALLYLLFLFFYYLFHKDVPVVKRNVLFFLLIAQVFLSVSTFLLYYNGSSSIHDMYINAGIPEQWLNRQFIDNAAPWILLSYFTILLARVSMLTYNWFRFNAESKSSWAKPSIDVKLFTLLKSYELGIKRKVTVWMSDRIKTPMTFGFFKPVILLPVALLNQLTLEETETLIIHELTHIRNNDYFLNWVLIACESLYFFNPFIKLMGDRIRLQRELNCDTQVIQFRYPATGYAETLLKTAIFKKRPVPFYLAAVAKQTQLLNRIHFFTSDKNLLFNKRNYSGLLIAPVLVLLFLNIFFLNSLRSNKNASTAEPVVFANIPLKLNEGFNTVISNDPVISQKNKNQTPPASLNKPYNPVKQLQGNMMEEEGAPDLTDEPVSSIMTMPVAVTLADGSKEIILKEESSATGKTITKVYKMKFEHGEWKIDLLLTVDESGPATTDSNRVKNSAVEYYNPVQ